MLPQKLTDRAFWRSESAAAGAMLIAAAAGLAAANSPLASAYTDLVVFKLAGQTLLAWVNEGLMVWFFLLVGLEIRREIAARGLATMRAPLVAAAGGMLVPALMYLAAVGGDARWARGWAIPAATDIAFALAALRAVGASAEAKRLLVSLAIFDDMGAVLVIALFYAKKLILWRLVAAAACLGAIGWLARRGARQSWIYALFGALAWAAMLHSGVHATTIGVLIAFLIPRAVAERWERALLGWVNWAVLPVFALANAGVPFVHLGSEAWLHPVPVAVMLGLVAGKPLGVLAGLW
ncbi:MAG: Na+/H+ antiporter NhaA, partial [Zetaproteobacteria bacterium]